MCCSPGVFAASFVASSSLCQARPIRSGSPLWKTRPIIVFHSVNVVLGFKLAFSRSGILGSLAKGLAIRLRFSVLWQTALHYNVPYACTIITYSTLQLSFFTFLGSTVHSRLDLLVQGETFKTFSMSIMAFVSCSNEYIHALK